MAVMAIKENKKSILGPIIPKKHKLKKEKEIVLTKDSIKKLKKPKQEIEDTTTNEQLLLKPKKKKKKHVEPEKSNIVQDQVESLKNDEPMEESGVIKSKKQKKSKKNKFKTSDGLVLDEDNEALSEKTVKRLKTKKRKFSETDLLIDSDDDSETDEEVPAKKKKEDEKEPEDPELKARTVFVGNIPLKTSKKAIQKFFKEYGKIESIRIRGLPGANPKLSKKVVAIKQEFHPGRNNFICFIRYKFYVDISKYSIPHVFILDISTKKMH